MAFWSSDRIAPYVIECEFAPNTGFLFGHENQWDMEMYHITRFVEAFFAALVPFQNLATFKARSIPFSDKTLSDLCQLRSLKTLEVTDCLITATSNPGPLTVERFVFSSHVPQAVAYDIGAIGWAEFLAVPRLKHVEMHITQPLTILLRSIISVNPQPRDGEWETFFPALGAFLEPARELESLTIEPFSAWGEWPWTFQTDLFWEFPSLREYDGPRILLDKMIIGDRLKTLHIRAFMVEQFVAHQDVARIFHTRPELTNTLESLGLWVSATESKDLFKIVQRGLPNLRELKLSLPRNVDESQVNSNF